MRGFLRPTTVGKEPLAVAMAGIRAGERALQIGLADPVVAQALAVKPGLNGYAAVAVTGRESAERARRMMARSGAVVDVATTDLRSLPFEESAFDVAVLHNRDGLLSRLGPGAGERLCGECRRILRNGGRLVVFERGRPTGLSAVFRSRRIDQAPSGTIAALEAAGFRAVRLLGERDGLRFLEATNVKTDRA